MKKIVPLTLLALGAVMVAIGLALAVRTISFVNAATETEGKVVALESRRGTSKAGSTAGGWRRRSRTHRPVFEFKDAQGQLHRVTESVGSRPAMFELGEMVTVLYNPAEPGQAKIKAISTLWFGAGFCVCFGGVFGLAGFLVWKQDRRRPAKKSP